ncbi:MAG: class II fructose-bisphosphate aldolase [Firmicutes bacterium]|nr:class II fructose-bisphosphate aldolase [Bacillota bacterium]
MPLVSTKDMLLDAQRKGYAIGAFNANNLEMAQGIVRAAELEEAPVIVQVSQGGAEHAGVEEMAAIVQVLAKKTRIPVALHLDHGVDFVYNLRCLRAGFTSLMYDGSQLSFDENARITREVVRAAHAVNVPVEAELGMVPRDPHSITPEELKKYMTTPEEAKRFVELTKVDALAVAVGSMHKMKVKQAVLDIERIKAIRQAVSVPLVLHGASGVPDEAVQAAIEAGISKINVHTQLAKSFTEKIREILTQDLNVVDIRKYLHQAREALMEEVRAKIRLFGASGHASGISPFDETMIEPEEYVKQEIVE